MVQGSISAKPALANGKANGAHARQLRLPGMLQKKAARGASQALPLALEGAPASRVPDYHVRKLPQKSTQILKKYQVMKKEIAKDGIAVFFMAVIIAAIMFLVAMCDPAYSQKVTQQIDLKPGWQIISSYVIPDDDSLSHIFDMSKVDLIVNMKGVYWPQGNVKSIHRWDQSSGYKVKMNQADRIYITGEKINGSGYVTYLTHGINFMTVPVNQAVDFYNLFKIHLSDVFFAINMNTMEIYTSELGEFSNLYHLIPGHGYLIFMLNQAEVVW